MGALEVSFNSPQCGWMSIGFADGAGEFHTTTAHSPYLDVLEQFLVTLAELSETEALERFIRWNRDPEEFDFVFVKAEDELLFEVYEFPTDERNADDRELRFSHRGDATAVCRAFYETFAQLYEDRETDEFEFNWKKPFPEAEFAAFSMKIASL